MMAERLISRTGTTIADLHHIVDICDAFYAYLFFARRPQRGNWGVQVTLNGTSGDQPITFGFNEGDNPSTISVGGKDYAMAPSSRRIFDHALQHSGTRSQMRSTVRVSRITTR